MAMQIDSPEKLVVGFAGEMSIGCWNRLAGRTRVFTLHMPKVPDDRTAASTACCRVSGISSSSVSEGRGVGEAVTRVKSSSNNASCSLCLDKNASAVVEASSSSSESSSSFSDTDHQLS